MFSKKFTNIFIVFLYFSLILGLFFNEDLIGGAQNDFKGLFHLIEKFQKNNYETLLNYNNFGHRQSPIFYFFSAFFIKEEIFSRIFYTHLFLLIPIFFYKCLKLVYVNHNKEILKIFSALILIFPTFRSYSFWPDPHLLGFLFFIIAIYFFLKFKKNNRNLTYPILNTIILSLSAYVSPNFGVFVIYFFYKFYKKFGCSYRLLILVILNLLLSFPFFYYLFYLDVNFLFNNNSWDIGENFISLTNISNKIIIISSIFLFFILPIIDFKKLFLKNNLESKNSFIITFLIFLFSIYFFDFDNVYKLTNSGGGIFYNISKYFFNNHYFLYTVSFIALYLISKICEKNPENIIIFICILLSNPQLTVWQANHSPTIFVLLLLLFNINFLKDKFYLKDIFQIYLYFFLYIFVSWVKFLIV